MTRPSWDERIQRAEKLAQAYPFAAEVLRFYQNVSQFQKELYAHIESACGKEAIKKPNGSLRDEFDLSVLLPKFPGILSRMAQAGSSQLAEFAAELADKGQDTWISILAAYWTGDSETDTPEANPATFLARAFLQPYAEYLAEHTECPPVTGGPPICSLCRGKPQVGVLRQEGDGAKRSLICSFCLTEWDYRRIVCPACGEENVDNLCVYTASQFEHVRVEACETCKHYIKTVDLTKNGLAVPVVDELATIPLNLWAQEKGYTKLQSNLLGM